MSYKNYKIILVVVIGVLTSFSFASAKNFTIHNANNINQPYFSVNGVSGNVGIGLTNPSSPLQMLNNSWISARNAAGTGAVNMFKINANDQIEVGAPLNIGSFEFSPDSGLVTFVDMPVSAAPTIGTPEGYVFKIDGDNLMTIYSESNGLGGVQSKRIGIGLTNPLGALHVAGTENVIFNSTGNIGIGTTSPVAKLAIGTTNNIAMYAGGRYIAGLDLTPINPDHATSKQYVDSNFAPIGTGIGSAFVQGGNSFGTTATLGTNDNNLLNIETNNSVRMTVAANGNVGVGTTGPSELFHISKSAGADDVTTFIENTGYTAGASTRLLFSTKGTDGNPYQASIINRQVGAVAGDLVFNTQGSDRMTIQSTGNVGIGTTAPSSKLSVSGGNVTIFPNGRLTIDKGAGGASGGGYFEFTNGNPGIVLGITDNSDTNHIVFKTRPTDNIERERMRITGLGNVGIGTTNPSSALHVNGAITLTKASGDTGQDPYLTTMTSANGYGGIVLNKRDSYNNLKSLTFQIQPQNTISYITANTNSLTLDAGLFTGSAKGFSIGSSYFATAPPANGMIVQGNVGIGTTSPRTPLDFASSTGDVIHVAGGQIAGLNSTPTRVDHAVPLGYLQSNYAPIGSGAGSAFVQGGNSFGGVATLGTNDNNLLNIETNNTVRMTVAANGNVGVGMTNPAVKLNVDGQLRVDNGSFSLYYPGTARTVASIESINTGSGADDGVLRLYRDGVATAQIIADTAAGHNFLSYGNLGIGESNPTSKLEVAGDIEISSGSLIRNSNYLNSIQLYNGSDASMNFTMGHASVGYFTFKNNSSELVRITRLGNVGIGTTNPLYPLHVYKTGVNNQLFLNNPTGTIGDTSGILFGTSPSETYAKAGVFFERLDGSAQGSLHFSTGNSGGAQVVNKSNARMTITMNGNVGIGTTSPVAKLAIGTTDNTTVYAGGRYLAGLDLTPINPDHAVPLAYLQNNYSSTSSSLWGGTKNGNIWNGDSGAGNVGIGTTTPTEKLEVTGNVLASGFLSHIKLKDHATQYGAIGGYSPSGGNYRGLSLLHNFVFTNSNPSSQINPAYSSWAVDIGGTDAFKYGTPDAFTIARTPAGSTTWSDLFTIVSTGNVGIGTTNPGAVEPIDGWSGNTNNRYLEIKNNAGVGFRSGIFIRRDDNVTGLDLINEGNTGDVYIANRYNSDSARIIFLMKTAGTDVAAMSISGSSNVGIGTTTPADRLVVNRGNVSNSAGGIVINNDTTNGYGGSLNINGNVAGVNYTLGRLLAENDGSGSYLTLSTAASGYGLNERMRITTTGNIGIGTTSPRTKLDFASSTGDVIHVAGGQVAGLASTPTRADHAVSWGHLQANYAPLGSGVGSAFVQGGNSFGGVATLGTNDNNLLNIETNNSIRMTVAANGNVGIGTTAPGLNASYIPTRLHVYSNSMSGTAVTIENASSTGLLGTELLLKSDNATRGNGVVMYNTGDKKAWGMGTTYGGSGNFQIGYVSDYTTQGTFQETETLRGDKGLLTILSTGNVGIGTTNPGASLEVSRSGSDVLRLTNSQNIDGTAWSGVVASKIDFYNADPSGPGVRASIQAIGSSDSGTPNGGVANYDLAFVTGSYGGPGVSEKFRITNLGNVGIGTTNPTSLLHIQGNYSGGTDNLIPQMKIINTSTSGGYAFIKTMMGTGYGGGYPELWVQATGGTTGTVGIRGVGNHDMNFWTNNTEKMRLTKDGNVGIGTTSPVAKLAIGTTDNTAVYAGGRYIAGLDLTPINPDHAVPLAYLQNNYSSTSSSLWGGTKNGNIWNGSAGAGNVGIGTTNPTSKLELLSSTTTLMISDNGNNYNSGDIQSSIYFNNRWWSGQANPSADAYGDAAIRTFKDNSDGNGGTGMSFWTSATGAGGVAEWMRINKSGNIGIGTTNPTQKLHVNGSALIDVGNMLYFRDTGTYIQEASGLNIVAGSSRSINLAGGTGVDMTISSSGNVGIGTTNPAVKMDFFSSNSNYGLFRINRDSATKGEASMGFFNTNARDTANAWVIGAGPWGSYTSDYDSFVIGNNNGSASSANSIRMMITKSGNVGIGTTNPGYRLSLGNPVADTTNSKIAVYENVGGGNYFYGLGLSGSGADTGLAFWGGTETAAPTSTNVHLFIKRNSGNVGIGTTSPVAKLAVSGGTGNVISAGGGRVANIQTIPINDDEAVSKYYVDANFAPLGGSSKWSDGPSGSIYRSSNVGIGVTNPLAQLHVGGGVVMKRTPVSDTDYTVQADDYIIGYTSISVNRTLTIPNALCTPGRFFVVVDESGNASASAKIIIDPEGTTPIIGLQTLPLEDSFNSVYVFCGNLAWYIL